MIVLSFIISALEFKAGHWKYFSQSRAFSFMFMYHAHCDTGCKITRGITHFYTLPHEKGRVLWFHFGHLCVCLCVHPSVFHFQMIT